jgi:hypothetical protein
LNGEVTECDAGEVVRVVVSHSLRKKQVGIFVAVDMKCDGRGNYNFLLK